MLKQQQGSIRIDFSTYVKIFKESNEVGASVEVYSKVLTGSLLEAIGKACGWTECSFGQRET